MEEDFNIWQTESTHKKILRQFNTPKSQGGFNCNGHEEYPRMMYKAHPHPLGGRLYVALEKDELSLDRREVIVDAQAFNRKCQLEVKDAEMEARARRDGWHPSMAEAMLAVPADQEASAIASAHQNYLDRGMSDKALKEKEAYELSVPGHVASVPEKRRARKQLSPEHKAAMLAGRAKAREAKKQAAS